MGAMMEIKVYPDKKRLAQAAAEHFADQAAQAIVDRGRFCAALAGGSTPRAMYSLLAGTQFAGLDWARIYLFWGDERCVPLDHPDSNYRMAKEVLLDHIPIPTDHVYPMYNGAPEEESAMVYQRVLADFFPPSNAEKRTFDLVLLGMGDDGHTASLFPGSAALEETEKWVAVVPHDQPPPPLVTRLSLTLPAINSAAQVTILVSGASKAQRLRQALQAPVDGGEALPVRRVQPHSGNMLWLVDRAARGQ